MDANHYNISFKNKTFLPFFLTQFLGAFNDNILRNAVIFIYIFSNTNTSPEAHILYTNIVLFLFVFPTLIFSPLAGKLSDKYEKSKYIQLLKIFEVLIMILASISIIFHFYYLSLIPIILISIQYTLFGPVKYSLPTALFKNKTLKEANGFISASTQFAILVASMLASFIIATKFIPEYFISFILILTSILGYASSKHIPINSPNDKNITLSLNFYSTIKQNLNLIYKKKNIFHIIICLSWFWFLSVSFINILPMLVNTLLNTANNETIFSFIYVILIIGISIGSLACKFFKNNNSKIICALSLLFISLISLLLVFNNPNTSKINNLSAIFLNGYFQYLSISIFFLGFCFGIYFVQLMYQLEIRSPNNKVSQIIAGNNFLNAIFMILSAISSSFIINLLQISIIHYLVIISFINILVITYLIKFYSIK